VQTRTVANRDDVSYVLSITGSGAWRWRLSAACRITTVDRASERPIYPNDTVIDAWSGDQWRTVCRCPPRV
jgi:hypothetical protein